MLVILTVQDRSGKSAGDAGDASGGAQEIGRWIFASDVPDARRQTDAAGVPLFSQWLGPRNWLAPGRYEIGAAPDTESSRYIVLVN